jgi:hypothetical protein
MNRGEEAVGSTVGVFSVMVLAQEMNVSISRRVLWVGLKSFCWQKSPVLSLRQQKYEKKDFLYYWIHVF